MGIHRNGWVFFPWDLKSLSYGAFLWIKIVKNYQKWVYIEMGGGFVLKT